VREEIKLIVLLTANANTLPKQTVVLCGAWPSISKQSRTLSRCRWEAHCWHWTSTQEQLC